MGLQRRRRVLALARQRANIGPDFILSPVHLAGFIPAPILHVGTGVPAFVLREKQQSTTTPGPHKEQQGDLGSRTLLSSRSSACIQIGLLSSVQTRCQTAKMMTKIGVFLSARRFDEISGGWGGNANVKLLRTLRQRSVIPELLKLQRVAGDGAGLKQNADD